MNGCTGVSTASIPGNIRCVGSDYRVEVSNILKRQATPHRPTLLYPDNRMKLNITWNYILLRCFRSCGIICQTCVELSTFVHGILLCCGIMGVQLLETKQTFLGGLNIVVSSVSAINFSLNHWI